MIVDRLSNLAFYAPLLPDIDLILDFLQANSVDDLACGRYELLGTDVYANVEMCERRSVADALLESHETYLDVQIPLSTTEGMGWRSKSCCHQIHTPYDAQRDICFWNDSPTTFFDVAVGEFVIFFPDDVHAPLLGRGVGKKIVIKVKIN